MQYFKTPLYQKACFCLKKVFEMLYETGNINNLLILQVKKFPSEIEIDI